MSAGDLRVSVVRAPGELSGRLRDELGACWMDTTNAGGAVGFPFPPVDRDEVRPAVDQLADEVAAGRSILVVARRGERLVGWVSLDLNEFPLVAHWATVRRLQSHPDERGRGVGTELMQELTRVARADGLERLRMAVRGGMGLEDFYRRLGWEVVGTWPGALRLGEGDDRDEVLMALELGAK